MCKYERELINPNINGNDIKHLEFNMEKYFMAVD
jgi:hypothetical protein